MASGVRLTGPAQFVFPGLASNCLVTPNVWSAAGLPQQELIIRVSAPWKQPVPDAVNGFAGIIYLPGGCGGLRRVGNTQIQFYSYSSDGTAFIVLLTMPAGWVDDQMLWLRGTSTDTAVTLYWALDQAAVPTTWTQLGTTAKTKPGQGVATADTVIGAESVTGLTRYLAGRIARVIVRSTIGGADLLDINESDASDPSAPTFPCTTGQRITEIGNVIQAA